MKTKRQDDEQKTKTKKKKVGKKMKECKRKLCHQTAPMLNAVNSDKTLETLYNNRSFPTICVFLVTSKFLSHGKIESSCMFIPELFNQKLRELRPTFLALWPSLDE